MEFRLLGQLEVARDGQLVDIGPFRQRSLLALLLLHRGRVVSTDQILECLWGEDDAAAKQKVLWVYVSNLRSALEPDREKRSEGTLLRTRAPGYIFDVNGHDVDVDRFEKLLGRARHLIGSDEPAAVETLDEALALWRGEPFEEFVYEGFADSEIARLGELQMGAIEAKVEAQLALGRPAAVVSDLEQFVREFPTREGLTSQLMVALYRSGRQAEALRAFQRFRVHLRDEAGLEPSAGLRDLEAQIVIGDPSLLEPATNERATVRSYEIGERLGEGSFSVVHRGRQPVVDREVALKVIRPELANDPDFVRRFEAEAQLVARLEHPHIVPLYDFWREPNAAYLVMRLLRGGALSSRLVDSPLSIDETTRLVAQVGDALAFAHHQGVVHRDVKPANVFLDESGQFYLGDFGIAVDVDTGPDPMASISLGSPAYASPEQLSRRSVGPAADVFGFAVTVYEALAGRLPFQDARSQAELTERQLNEAFPGLSGFVPGLSPAVDAVIERATAKDPEDRFADVASFVTAFLDASDAEPRSEAAGIGLGTFIDGPLECPYVGLAAFGEADARRFRGRDRLIGQLLERLEGCRMLTVVGPSGSGKSSLVRAGLVPAVRNGGLPGSDRWFVVTATPGRDPYEELEAALLRVAVNPPPSLREQLISDDRGIARAVRRVLPEEGSQLLLVLDQFEELFTLCDDEHLRRSFLRALVAAVTDDRSGLRVVATCRADYYDRPLRQVELAQLMRDGTVPITPLAPDELERAIVEPAAPSGVQFEPGLVSAIVAAVNDQPGALPLLQFTLTRLWDARAGQLLTLDAYREIGGVSGALAAEAESQYNDLDPAQQLACRTVFRRLVTPGEGRGDARRRADRAEIEAIPHGVEVVDRFGDAQLLAFDRDRESRRPTVEVAHEALLREWPRLSQWIDEDRDGMRVLRRLSQAAESWEANDRDPSELLRGGRLEEAVDYASGTQLAPVEAEFVAAGTVERDRIEDAERRRLRRLQGLLGALAIIAVVALLAGGLAFFAQRRADREAAEADLARTAGEVRRMAADAPQLAKTDGRLGFLLAAEAHRRDPSPLTLGALQRVLLETEGLLGFLGAGSAYERVVWSPDEPRLAAVGVDQVDLFDANSFAAVASFPARDASFAAYGAGGSLAVVSESRRVLVYSVASGDVTRSFDVAHRVTSIEFGPEGLSLFVGDEEGDLTHYDIGSGVERWRVSAHSETPDGLEATGGMEAPGAHEPRGFELGVGHIAVGGDGREIATSGAVFVRLWDVESGARISEIVVQSASAAAPTASEIDLREDGSIAVRTGRALQVHDRESGSVTERAAVLSDIAAAVAESGAVTASFHDDLAFLVELDQAAVIDLSTGETRRLIGLQSKSAAANVAVSPDGRTLASAGEDGVAVHALDGRGLISRSGENVTRALGVQMSPDGQLVGFGNNTGRQNGWSLWALDGPRPTLLAVDLEPGRISLEIPDAALLQDSTAGLRHSDIEGLEDWEPTGEPFAVVNNYSQAFHADTGLLAFGGGPPDEPEAVLHIYDAASLELVVPPITTLDDEGASAIVSTSFNRDGSRLAVASLEGIAHVFDTRTWESVAQLGGGDGAVIAVEYSSDGRFLATSRADGQILLRDAETNQRAGAPLIGSVGGTRFAGHQPLAFSSDGRHLMSTIDGSGRLWDLATRTQIGTAFESAIGTNMTPAKDASRLALVTEDGFVVYDLDPDEWFDVACQAAGRNMTAEEWEQFGPEGAAYEQTCGQWPGAAPSP